jgi:deoxyribodipyrimidine photo-lyase
MEFENVNRAYVLVKPKNESYIKAWQEGKRVFHCRCLHAVLGSDRLLILECGHGGPFHFNLWQDWRELHFLEDNF